MFIAWDIETCPFDFASYSPTQLGRYQALMEKNNHADLDPDSEEGLKQRSLHPLLGWICCISAVAASEVENPRPPKSYVAATPDEEEELLTNFWADIARFPKNVQWITYFGKGFDVDFLLARTLHHGLEPSRKDILDSYPFNHYPHADLCKIWSKLTIKLDELCALLDVPSPKDENDGSGVYQMVRNGELDKLQRYCEKDVQATFECFSRIPLSLLRKNGSG